MKTVFILGAGASRAAGGPLMCDFVTRADAVQQDKKSLWAKDHFDHVLSARRKLQRAYAKSTIDLDNIECLFSTFEMASLIGRLSDLKPKEVEELPAHMRYVILRTLEQSILFSINGADRVVPSPHPYDAFAELLIALADASAASPLCIINFNYDLCLDYAITLAGRPIFYGLPEEGHMPSAIHHYKVHGSLNWFRGPDERIRSELVKPLSMQHYWDRLGLNRPALRTIDTMEVIHGPNSWGEALTPEPIIVPPTFNKRWYQDQLRSVWRSASQALYTAENIFVIGYSLPASDQFFQHFFALSTISDSIIERFWLFDPSTDHEISARYKALLGPAIHNRNRCSHKQVTFEEAIRTLAELYGFTTEFAAVKT